MDLFDLTPSGVEHFTFNTFWGDQLAVTVEWDFDESELEMGEMDLAVLEGLTAAPYLDNPGFSIPEGVSADGIAGNSFAWSDDWFNQQVDGFCGPTSVAIILNEFLDAGITDPFAIAQDAVNRGLMSPASYGMHIDDIETLLSAYGVPCETVGSSMNDLAVKLERGYGVIAYVDADEVWHGPQPNDDAAGTNHALLVTEINYGTGLVTLADPGHPDGNMMRLPIDQFADAWADSGQTMLVASDPNPELADPRHIALLNATGNAAVS